MANGTAGAVKTSQRQATVPARLVQGIQGQANRTTMTAAEESGLAQRRQRVSPLSAVPMASALGKTEAALWGTAAEESGLAQRRQRVWPLSAVPVARARGKTEAALWGTAAEDSSLAQRRRRA
ncbi:hypothetical protein GPECTOR_125g511 [Gonium pectorale]|uniref:Uncharacterized protein n=1 Tax=Gonium pectorale TaxID=33097 RepID=A0A150FYL8_GONPE|nr:hypothetical protein GPECTOR_125g511 [Gonium pectorale]|eukprot:KXZ42678.1 hypothetical protein GPECTOR_125g511 [Gonium pectorale]